MKKFFNLTLFVFFSLAVLLLVPGRAFALTGRLTTSREPFDLLGQDHYYSVMFRGNGEAVVTARIIFANNGDQPLSSLNLRVPRVDPKDAFAFQVLRDQACSRYQPTGLKEVRPPICLEYQNIDYFQPWFGGDKYQKAKVVTASDTLSIALPQAIKPGASGSVVLSFRAFGYARKNLFGSYDFTFETLKIEDRIKTLQIGITTDSDVYLRGGKGKVDYRFKEGAAALQTTNISAPIASSQFDYFVQQIGQGEINKTANNLLALDSYLVKGSFADSRIKLYAREILIITTVIFIFFYLIFRLVKKISSVSKPGYFRILKADSSSADLLLVFGLSFIAALLIAGYTLALIFGRGLLASILPYEVNNALSVLTILVSLGVYGLFLSLPALIVGFRRGVFWGLAAFGMTIFWLLVGGVIAIFVFLSTANRIYPPYPITPMMGVAKPVNSDSNQPKTGRNL